MSENATKSGPKLPVSLQGKLQAYRTRLWQMKIAEAVMAGVFGLLLSYLTVFALDRFIDTSSFARLVILIAGTSLFAIFAPFWLRKWVWANRSEEQLARLIAKKHPRFGDRLLGVVELQDHIGEDSTASPVLREAALRSVTAEVEQRDLSTALPNSNYRRWSIFVLLLFVGATSALVIMPEAGMNAMKRWLLPLSDTPRYTFAEIEGLPDTLIVPYGETYELAALLTGGSSTTPPVGTAKLDRLPAITAELDKRQYLFKIPGLQVPTSMTIAIGDIRKRIRIEPVIRPSIEAFEAQISLPDYLNLPKQSIDVRTGVLTALQGSSVNLIGQTTRNLSEVSVKQIDTSNITLNEDEFTTAPIKVETEAFDLSFTWKDIHGLSPSSEYKLKIEPVADGSPSAYIQGINRQHVMLAEETVEFEVLSEDDYGIKEFGLEWLGEHSSINGTSPPTGDLRLAEGGPGKLRLSSPSAFSPATVNIGPQKLQVRAYVEDYLPNRGRIYSEPITLFILSRDEHAQMLKEKFDRIIGELEDSARQEETNLEENKRIDKLESKELNKAETKKRLKEQQDSEEENIEKLEKLNERIEELFKDSVRNGGIQKETLRKLAESMKSLNELSTKDLPEVSKSLEKAQDQENNNQQTAKNLDDAIKQQQEAVKKMKEAIAAANEANSRYEASTFVNRIRRAARDERGIARHLAKELNNLVGFNIQALDPAQQRAVQTISEKQRQTNSDIRWIEEDLIHYLNRTSKPKLQSLLDTLQKEHIAEGLDELNSRITQNHTVQSIHGANYWADLLNKWAEEAGNDSAEGQGGGGGGGSGGSEQDFEFNLRVMKMIQTEQDLRARTRALEQLRRSAKKTTEPAA